MALTPSAQYNKITWIENQTNYCVIAKSSTVKSHLLGDSIIARLKQYDYDMITFGRSILVTH